MECGRGFRRQQKARNYPHAAFLVSAITFELTANARPNSSEETLYTYSSTGIATLTLKSSCWSWYIKNRLGEYGTLFESTTTLNANQLAIIISIITGPDWLAMHGAVRVQECFEFQTDIYMRNLKNAFGYWNAKEIRSLLSKGERCIIIVNFTCQQCVIDPGPIVCLTMSSNPDVFVGDFRILEKTWNCYVYLQYII